MTKYDTVIVGGGSAGCSAAIYTTRFKLNTLLVSGPMPGGLITEALDVENYPGIKNISGIDLSKAFIDQALALGACYKENLVSSIEIVEDLEPYRFRILFTDGDVSLTKSVILATGSHHKKIGIPGELEFAGRGVSYCSTCDGPFFKNKIVAVIGGGNSAVEGALDIAVHASKVYIIYRTTLKASPVYIDHLRSKENIIEVPNTNVLEILGENFVKSVKLDQPYNGTENLEVNGVFVQIGYLPVNALAMQLNLKLNKAGYVVVDAGMGTNVSGVFCAGDLNTSSNMLHQQVTSAAEGAIAAQSAYRFVEGQPYLVPTE